MTTDPIVTLLAMGPARTWEESAALAELERRARIEARRDAWLRSVPGRRIDHYEYTGKVLVGCAVGPRDFRLGGGPDYHTALEAALNAAGAP